MSKKSPSLQVWKKGDVSIRQRGPFFYVGRFLPVTPNEWKPPHLVFGPLPSREGAVDFAKDYFFGVKRARRRSLIRAQLLIKKLNLSQFDWPRLHGNYLCVLTAAAKPLSQ